MTSQAANENANLGIIQMALSERPGRTEVQSQHISLQLQGSTTVRTRVLFHCYSSEVTADPRLTGSGLHPGSNHMPAWTLALLCAGAALFSADRHLTQINAELGGAVLLSNKDAFKTFGRSMCWTGPICARPAHVQLDVICRMTSTSCQNKLGNSFKFRRCGAEAIWTPRPQDRARASRAVLQAEAKLG